MRNIIATILSVLFIYCQSNASDALIGKIKSKILSVKDFKAEAMIAINIEFLKSPVSKATILYKAPNTVRIVSEGFSMLPKQGAGIPIASLLQSQFTFVDLPDEMYKGKKCKVMKIFPIADTGQIIASTIWVDEQKSLVNKMSAITKNGTLLIEMDYSKKYEQYALPDKVQLSFDIPPFSLPKSMTGDLLAEKKSNTSKKTTKGSATITYSNYVINKGFSESQMK